MVASFRLLSVCGQAGIMGAFGQSGEFGRDILREIIALEMPEMIRGWIYLGHVVIRRDTL